VDFKMGGPEEGIDADLALVSSGMTSKVPVTLKDGSGSAHRCVRGHPSAQPADGRTGGSALSGAITDYGVVTVDCIGEKNGKPASVGYAIFPPDIKWVNERIPGATSVSYGTSTPASIYAELIVEGRITDQGLLCPEELPRAARDAFLAECGRRGLPVTRTETFAAN
jgi:hypothetical protein